MDINTLLQYLHNTLQPDGNIRAEAETAIKSLIQNRFQDSLSLFIRIILDKQLPQPIRQMCSIITKNSLHSKNRRIQSSYEARWLACPVDFRLNLIETLNGNLNCREAGIMMNLGKIYGSIIRIEMVNATGQDMMTPLQALISNPSLAVGILNAVQTACDQLYEETSYTFGPEKYVIFNICTYYLNQETNPSRDVLHSALTCIMSCLEVFEDVLSTAASRQHFIQQIFACPRPDDEILEISLEVVNRLVDVYSHLSDDEVVSICQIYFGLFDAQPSDIPLQVFDLWFLILELEKYNVIKQFIPTLVQRLLLCITKEDPDDISPSPHKSSCALLMEITSKMNVLLLSEQIYQNFIFNNFRTNDLEKHAIAANALGSICTPGSNDFLYQVLPILIDDLSHEVCVNEALFAISKICETEISTTVNFLPTIIQKAGILIKHRSKVAVNAVGVYSSIISAMKSGIVKEVESIMLFHYSDILQLLIHRLDMIVSGDYELRAALSIALADLISCCHPSNKIILDQLQNHFITKINSGVHAIGYATEQQHLIFDDVICAYIVLLEPCLKTKKIFDMDEIAGTFLRCLQIPNMFAHGEIYIVVSKLLSGFSIHLKKFLPFILRDISNQEVFVLKAALNLLSDCAILLESNFVEFTEKVIPALMNAISSNDVPMEIKPKIIVALADIALAIGRSFEPYISLCVLLLTHINTLKREGDEDFVDSLRKAALQLFSCLFVSVGKTEEMQSSYREVVWNIRTIIEDDKDSAYVGESVDVINDIQTVVGSAINSDEEWMIKFLHSVIRTSTEKTQQKAKELLQTFY